MISIPFAVPGWVWQALIIAAALGLVYWAITDAAYDRGAADTRQEIQTKDKEAAHAAAQARIRVRDCLDAGRVWDASAGECRR